jgi:hypothetical protein
MHGSVARIIEWNGARHFLDDSRDLQKINSRNSLGQEGSAVEKLAIGCTST